MEGRDWGPKEGRGLGGDLVRMGVGFRAAR